MLNVLNIEKVKKHGTGIVAKENGDIVDIVVYNSSGKGSRMGGNYEDNEVIAYHPEDYAKKFILNKL